MLPKEAIIEFKELYRRKFGVELSMAEATQRALDFFNLMKVILKPNLASKKTSN